MESGHEALSLDPDTAEEYHDSTLPAEGAKWAEEKLCVDEAEAGMAEMSKRFHDENGELYLPAAE